MKVGILIACQNLNRLSLTAQVGRSPLDEKAFLGAGSCVGAQCGAQALAVAALVAAASVENASSVKAVDRHLAVTLCEF